MISVKALDGVGQSIFCKKKGVTLVKVGMSDYKKLVEPSLRYSIYYADEAISSSHCNPFRN
jgi:hypothetical protein